MAYGYPRKRNAGANPTAGNRADQATITDWKGTGADSGASSSPSSSSMVPLLLLAAVALLASKKGGL